MALSDDVLSTAFGLVEACLWSRGVSNPSRWVVLVWFGAPFDGSGTKVGHDWSVLVRAIDVSALQGVLAWDLTAMAIAGAMLAGCSWSGDVRL